PALVLVPRVRGLEGVGAGADLQHHVDEVLQLQIVNARADVDPVAGVPADPVSRQPAERVVQGLHPDLGPAANLVHAELGVRDVVGRQVRVVDLHEEAGIDDRAVLLVHGVRDREKVLLVRLVVGVPLPVLDAGRGDGRDERLLDRRALKRGLEVVDVRLHVLGALVGDGAGADHVHRPRGRARHRAAEPLVELGEGFHLARAAPRAAPALPVGLEAREALADVGNEAGLAHLAVVDDVEAELRLLADDLAHRALHPARAAALIVGLRARLRPDQLEQVGGTRQAPRVRGEDAVAAALHGLTSSPGSRTRSWSPAGRTRAFASRRPSWSSPT